MMCKKILAIMNATLNCNHWEVGNDGKYSQTILANEKLM